ncbi:hypothetical protein H4Q26_007914 [Puccinia striiformis f. sp. tritici PST-130]|nr:hypothetical protein H4Q26_007914 [Puccinia striiformis f. sp. tritici PST-130]
MSSKARATFLFILSLGQVGLCFPPGQVTHVLDEPAEVISTRSVGDEPIDRLQQNGTPFSESGLEGPVDSPEVPGNVHHGGRDVYQPSPTHSHHSHHNLMAGYQFDQQPGKSRKLEESIQAKHQVIDLNLPPPQILHTGPTLPMRKPGTGTVEYTVPTEVIDWLIKEAFEPKDSLPVLGVAGQSNYPMDEAAFGDLQKILINFLSADFSKEDCIMICLSILKLFPNTSHHDLDFIYNMPKPGPGSQFLSKDQLMMRAIHSFKLQKRILSNIRQNTKASGLEGKRKAENPIDHGEREI